jgi:Protein of unknown function (DUF3551)
VPQSPADHQGGQDAHRDDKLVVAHALRTYAGSLRGRDTHGKLNQIAATRYKYVHDLETHWACGSLVLSAVQRRFKMRVLIGLGALAAILAADIQTASAQNPPWCLRSAFSGPGWCGFDSYTQCWAGGPCIEYNMLAWERQKAEARKRPQRRQQRDEWRY